MNKPERSTCLPRAALRVSAVPGFISKSLGPQILAFSAPPHIITLNCTAGSTEVSVISLSLLWGSFPTPTASQKANYTHQWPASSNRISDGCGTVSVSAWSAPLYPMQSSQGALATGHFSCLFLLHSQPKLLRNLYADQEATVRTGHGTTDWF